MHFIHKTPATETEGQSAKPASRKGAFAPFQGQGLSGDGWRVFHASTLPLKQSPSLFVIGNGFIGVRALPEEGDDSASTYLNAVYEQVAIHYHEAAFGFARTSDTRLPAPNALHWAIQVDGESFSPAGIVAQEQSLDLRTGLFTRQVMWRTAQGQSVELRFERFASLERPELYAQRLTLRPEHAGALIMVRTWLEPPRVNASGRDAVYDPRLGPALDHEPWAFEGWFEAGTSAGRLDRLQGSGIGLASAVRMVGAQPIQRLGDVLTWQFDRPAPPDSPLEIVKFTAYATDRGHKDRPHAQAALAALEWGEALGFADLVAGQRAQLDRFWQAAQIDLPAQPALERALRFNALQVLQAAGTDGESSVAAKGQTGEGYEGHVFWDAECFMAPMLAFLAPERARAMLRYRAKGLDHARTNARQMGHARGALFPWRTIGGAECSAFFPAGAAQYHLNADIAYAIRTYAAATGDVEMLSSFGVEMLIETARIWLAIGHFHPERGFCLDKVTGPDEYSALVDNNYYTNAMAKAHLLDGVKEAQAMRQRDPVAYAALAKRLELIPEELELMARAAAQMRLPVCQQRGILAQDDAFLDKKIWDFAATPPHHYPLLLHVHPLTIYRHQVCKQADVVLALSMAGRDLDLALKQRTFDYYEGVTTHDSTLSPCGFAVAAAQIGRLEKAVQYLKMTALVDLEDLCGNADHGLHMAAMAGGWLTLAFGFAGLQLENGLRFAPRYTPALGPYGIRLRYHGRLLAIAISEEGVRYSLLDGEPLAITHEQEPLTLTLGAERYVAFAP